MEEDIYSLVPKPEYVRALRAKCHQQRLFLDRLEHIAEMAEVLRTWQRAELDRARIRQAVKEAEMNDDLLDEISANGEE